MTVLLRSITKEYAVICNFCGKQETVIKPDGKRAIEHFCEQGWGISKVIDLCPECQKEVSQ